MMFTLKKKDKFVVSDQVELSRNKYDNPIKLLYLQKGERQGNLP